jgi:hypothetical protein
MWKPWSDVNTTIVLALFAKKGHGVVVIMEDFSSGVRLIAVVLKVLENRHRVFQDRAVTPRVVILIVTIDARRVRIKARPETRTRRPTYGVRAVGVRETDPGSHQALDVRCVRLGMTAHALDGVV